MSVENIYNFSLVCHGDIVLENNNISYNLGYNFNSKLPISLFLNYLQLTGKNLFKEIIFPKTSRKPSTDSNLELLLEDSLESSKKLPTEISDIFKIATFRFNKFKNGNFSVQYEFDLVEGNLILINDGPDYLKTLTFNPIQSKDFLQSYIDFVFLEKGLEKTQSDIKRIYEVLGD